MTYLLNTDVVAELRKIGDDKADRQSLFWNSNAESLGCSVVMPDKAHGCAPGWTTIFA